MLILKSLLFTFYYFKVSYRNYIPLAIFLILFHYAVNNINSLFIIFVFSVSYLIISTPISVNIFRSIVKNEMLKNSYFNFYYETYTKLFLKKLFILISSIIGIYIAIIIILSPFLSKDIANMTLSLYLIFLYIIYIYTRLFFILPGAALDKSYSLKDSFNITKGYSIKIYLFYVSLILPYVFLSSLLTEFSSVFNPLTIVTISFIFQIFFSVLSTSIIGYLYKDVIEKRS
tara:strand:+ start:150 stop:839 length:690 start_codon:yes stop_codon:yes gene_type:complete